MSEAIQKIVLKIFGNNPILATIFIAMIPIIELRGAIPLGIAMDLNPIYVYLSCLIGSSIVSIPVVLVFRQVIDYLRHRKYFNIVIRWVDAKIESRAKKLKAASILGLIVFVGVPLPTTGSWSGAALASIFKMRIKDALFGVFIGNAIAGATNKSSSALDGARSSTAFFLNSSLLRLIIRVCNFLI